jgi:lipid-binding SYLF domain-containing protein
MPPQDPLDGAAKTVMQSPPVPTLREQAAMRASLTTMSPPTDASPSLDTHEPFPFPGTPHTPHQPSHPLSNSNSNSNSSFLHPNNETPDSLAHSARKEWQRHGSGRTQTLEDMRAVEKPGTLSVRVVSADTRRDVSGAKFTCYIVRVHLANGQALELEHRYSEFAKLHDLLQTHNIQMGCVFPEKHWAGRLGQWTPSLKWAPDKHDDLIQYRKIQLDVWLVHVVEQYNLGSLPHRLHQAVYDFLTHSDRPPCEQDNLMRNGTDTAESWTRWNNPLSFTLGSTIRQATATMEHMFPPTMPHTSSTALVSVWKESDQSIPLDLLQCAKGLCFLTVLKAGLVVSGRVGTGLLIARLDNKDQWSAPCALGTVGMGWGMLAGGDITHYLVVLTTTEAVDALLAGTVQLGAELGVAVGPVGRGATSQVAAGDWSVHPAYSYAHSQGFFVGMSLEGSVLTTRGDVNARFYGQHLQASQILDLPPPNAAAPLYQVLKRATAMEIPEDAFRPSQLFQDKSTNQYRRRPASGPSAQTVNTNEPQVDPSGRVTVPSAPGSTALASSDASISSNPPSS